MGDEDFVSRRRALGLGGAALLAGLAGWTRGASAALRNGEILRTPDFNLRYTSNRNPGPGQYTVVAGLRPHRSTGIRLQIDPVLGREQGKTVIHNYGHGGGGITLSLGCAMSVKGWVQTIVNARPANAPRLRVAVLGSGIAGMTVAKELVDLRPRVTVRILSKAQNIEDSVSWISGGQFAPSEIIRAYDRNPGPLLDLVRASRDRMLRLARDSSAYGIRERFNYSLRDVEDLKFIIPVIGAPKQDTLPFDKLRMRRGYEYKTWLIEPKVILKQLEREVKAKGAQGDSMNHT